MAFQVGQKIGDYEVLAVLGAGGMGQVYKVRNLISDRVEAMKVLLPNLEADPELADRFLREIKVSASLDHPNIAALRTAQRVDNQLVMIMEFVEGTTLDKLSQQGPLPMATAVDSVCQVLSALSFAHAHGVVHRDIKPANMMLTPAGVVKLMDFGIARVTADRRLTQTGKTVGSLFYMSPEQIKGGAVDARSDLYSLGVSLYELVTGHRPFQGDSDYSIMAAHLQQNPVPPIQLDPNVPSALNEIILMSIAKDPVQRFQTADAMKAALASIGTLMGVTTPAAELPGTVVMPAAVPPPPIGTPVMAPPPTVAAPIMSAPPPPPPLPVARSGGGRRGLYMAIGAVAALAVLAVAVTQAPKFLHTKANNNQPQADTPAQTTAQTQAQTTAQPPPPAATPQVQSAASSSPVAAPPTQVAATPAPAQTPPAAVHTPPVSRPERHTTPAPRYATPAAEQAQPQAPPAQPPANSYPQTAAQPSDPGPSPAQSKELERLREEYNEMSVRAASVKGGMRSLESQMARSGLGMRGDMKTTESRMDYLMQEAMSSIQSGNAAAAKKSLDSAELSLETLERFLNR